MHFFVLALLITAAVLFAVSYSRTKLLSDIALSIVTATIAFVHALRFGAF